MSLVTLEIDDVADVIDEAITRHVLTSHNDNKASKLLGDLLSFRSDLQELKNRINDDNRFDDVKSYIEVRISTVELNISSLKEAVERYRKVEDKLENYTPSDRFTKELSYLRDDVDREKSNITDFILKRLDELRESIVPLVRDEIGRIPLPKDGEPGTTGEKGERGESGEIGERGKDGESVTLDDIRPIIELEVANHIAVLPLPKDGCDGKSITIEDVASFIREEIEKSIALLPVAKDGEPGNPGKDGKSVDIEDIKTIITDEISKISLQLNDKDSKSINLDTISQLVKSEVANIHVPASKDGLDGQSVTVEDVAPLIKEEVEKSIASLPIPKDGVGLAGAVIDRNGNLVITCTNGIIIPLGKVIGNDGKDIDPSTLLEIKTRLIEFDPIAERLERRLSSIEQKGFYDDGINDHRLRLEEVKTDLSSVIKSMGLMPNLIDRVTTLEGQTIATNRINIIENELAEVRELAEIHGKPDLTDAEFMHRVNTAIYNEVLT